jgi:hypothetical protein
MKRTLVLLFIIIVSVAGIGYLSYKQSVAPKPAPETVSASTYKALANRYEVLQHVDDVKLKAAADQIIAKDQIIQTRTSQRDQLCTIYKNYKPAPTPALCQ